MIGDSLALWDPVLLLKHCIQDKNYITGEKGTAIDFLNFSFYRDPGTYKVGSLKAYAQKIRKAAIEYGLNDLKIGVDEGKVCFGTDKREVDGVSWVMPSRVP